MTVCTGCKKDKPDDQFGQHRHHPLQQCKTCIACRARIHKGQAARNARWAARTLERRKADPEWRARKTLHDETYRARHREAIRARVNQRFLDNPERVLAYQALYQERHPDRMREWKRKGANKWALRQRVTLSDSYVRGMMIRHTPRLKMVDLPQSLVEATRERMKIKRYLKEIKK